MLCYVYPISCRQDIEVSSEGHHPYGYSLWKSAKTRTENRSCGKWTGSLPWHYYQTLPPQALCHYPSARQIPLLLYCLMSSKKYCRQIAVLMTVRHSFQTNIPLNSVKSLLPDIADCADVLFPSLQVVQYISCNFHSYEFVAKLHIFPMKKVRYCTFLMFIILKGGY